MTSGMDAQALERLDPLGADEDLYAEHVARYQFAQDFAKGKRVLDCASGVGYGAALLADVAECVVGIDSAPEAIEEAQQRYARPNVRYLVADGRSLPLLSRTFDLVVSLETIEHTHEPERLLTEFRRVLRPSGVLIISTPNTDVYRLEDGNENPFHPHEFSVRQLSDMLRRYFPSVSLLAERHQSAVLIGPPEPGPLMTWFGDLRTPNADLLARSPYVVAVCSTRTTRPTGLVRFASGGSRMQELVAWARSGERELRRARERLQQVDADLAERTTWAQRVDAELAEARDVIAELQGQVAERTTWAHGLNSQLAEARDLLGELQDRVAERTTWAQTLDAQLAVAREEIAELQDRIVERTRWAQALDVELNQARVPGANALAPPHRMHSDPIEHPR